MDTECYWGHWNNRIANFFHEYDSKAGKANGTGKETSSDDWENETANQDNETATQETGDGEEDPEDDEDSLSGDLPDQCVSVSSRNIGRRGGGGRTTGFNDTSGSDYGKKSYLDNLVLVNQTRTATNPDITKQWDDYLKDRVEQLLQEAEKRKEDLAKERAMRIAEQQKLVSKQQEGLEDQEDAQDRTLDETTALSAVMFPGGSDLDIATYCGKVGEQGEEVKVCQV